MRLPTPRVIQAIIRQRTSVAIDRGEAGRLTRLAMMTAAPATAVVIHGRDRLTGEPRSVSLTIEELLNPPDNFVPPA